MDASTWETPAGVGEPGAAGGRALATAAFRIAAGRLTGAISSALTMRSGLGTGPWDTLFAALHGATGAGYGLLSAVAAVGLAGLAWAHGGRPRASMIGNAVAGGLLVGWVLPHVPRAGAGAGWAYAALALALGVLSGVLVLGTPHARTAYDGALVGVAARRGWGVGRTRLCLDVPALAAGWALGGRLGAGTVAGALLTGPLVQAALRVGAGGDLGAERAAPPRHARPPLAAPRLTPFEPARAIA